MPTVSKQVVVPLPGFLGGLNKDADPTRLAVDELPEALNVNIGLRGEISKRGGYQRYDSSGAGAVVVAMMNWVDDTTKEHLVCIGRGGAVVYCTDGSHGFTNPGQNIGQTWETPTHYPVGFAAAKGALYISSRRGPNTLKWTGTEWSEVPDVPRSQHLRWRFEQMFCANVAGGFSQLRISLPLEPENFVDEPAIIDFESDDGTEIRALASAGDDLMVFKDHAIHLFTGKVRSEFAKYRLDSLRGTFSPRTVKQVRGLIIFWDRDTGVWSWDGNEFALISEKINNYLLNGQNYPRAWMAVAHVRRDSYYLSMPWGGAAFPSRTFVFSTLTNTWTEWDIGWHDADRHADKDLVGGIEGPTGSLQGIHEGPLGWLDHGKPFTAKFKTAWLQPGGPGAIARLRRVETSMASTGADTTMTLHQGYSPDPVIARTFNATNSTRDGDTDLIKNLNGFPYHADAHQLEYSSNDNRGFQVNGASLIFTVRQDQLGEHF